MAQVSSRASWKKPASFMLCLLLQNLLPYDGEGTNNLNFSIPKLYNILRNINIRSQIDSTCLCSHGIFIVIHMVVLLWSLHIVIYNFIFCGYTAFLSSFSHFNLLLFPLFSFTLQSTAAYIVIM